MKITVESIYTNWFLRKTSLQYKKDLPFSYLKKADSFENDRYVLFL